MSIVQPKVMIIEDEALLLLAISKKLSLAGIETISCTGGQQALDYLESIPQLPDAIWLDYYLKDMDGLEFMSKLKANEKWGKIPVVVVSNSANPDKIQGLLALGVKKYVLKATYRLDEIVRILKEEIISLGNE
jgi:two-component system chemotaxis response regulator CheY